MLTITIFRSFGSASNKPDYVPSGESSDPISMPLWRRTASDITTVASRRRNFVIEEDGNVNIVTHDGEEGEQIEPHKGPPDNLGYLPSSGANSMRRIRIVHQISKKEVSDVLSRILNEMQRGTTADSLL
jgi:hypothetical protein